MAKRPARGYYNRRERSRNMLKRKLADLALVLVAMAAVTILGLLTGRR
jgi:hypothetical protein